MRENLRVARESDIKMKEDTHLRESEQERDKSEEETTYKHCDRYNSDSQASVHDGDFLFT